ncbi:hypothetical protein D4764_11G0007200 [Takifugu flavidus]|uniref:Uncharacterized protein n=1 Tax=Takifugu flavidus TaxID=433684 RepID=A0A5C6PI56_9TELE|nr:hypothetical protein D4764_11G0007200 [Takifugu flavidus]
MWLLGTIDVGGRQPSFYAHRVLKALKEIVVVHLLPVGEMLTILSVVLAFMELKENAPQLSLGSNLYQPFFYGMWECLLTLTFSMSYGFLLALYLPLPLTHAELPRDHRNCPEHGRELQQMSALAPVDIAAASC